MSPQTSRHRTHPLWLVCIAVSLRCLGNRSSSSRSSINQAACCPGLHIRSGMLMAGFSAARPAPFYPSWSLLSQLLDIFNRPWYDTSCVPHKEVFISSTEYNHSPDGVCIIGQYRFPSSISALSADVTADVIDKFS